ncbi:MAG TPA: hypothetical protein VGJ19_01390 [Streptosporangiaceae bacterium]|jgi:hypothetical protein
MTRPAPGPAAPAGPGTAGRTTPADPPDRARWARWAASRWGIAAGAALLAIGLFAAFIRLSATYPVNSDGANIVLMAWDMLHGNVLLHGWDMSDVSFWTTELPQYVLVSWVRGLGPDVPHIAAAMTYTLALVLAVLLAAPRGARHGGAGRNERLARSLLPAGIMLAPQLGPGVFVLLLSVGHIGTAVPMLATWLVLDRAPARWYRPVAAGLLLAWAVIADPLVLVVGIGPLAVVAAARAVRARLSGQGWPAIRPELALAGAALAAAGVAAGAPAAVTALGGYTVHTIPFHFVTWSTLGAHARTTGLSLLALFGAGFPGTAPGAPVVFAALHLAGLALVAAALVVVIGRFFGRDLADQVLTVAILANLAFYLASSFSSGVLNSREIAVVLPFGAALAGRTLGPGLARAAWPAPGTWTRPGRWAARQWLAPALLAVLAGYAASLGCQLTQAPAPPANARLARWLAAHHLTQGLSGYWQAGSVTLDSGGKVTVRPLVNHFGGLVPYQWEARRSWFDGRTQDANFIVFDRRPGYFDHWAPAREVRAVFGAPAATYRTGPYTIMVWHQNLLATLHHRQPAARPSR